MTFIDFYLLLSIVKGGYWMFIFASEILWSIIVLTGLSYHQKNSAMATQLINLSVLQILLRPL